MSTVLLILLFISFFALCLMYCENVYAKDIGIYKGRLFPCPQTPNTACSDCKFTKNPVEPLLVARLANPLNAVKSIMHQIDGAKLCFEDTYYLHYEVKSKIFRFVDDVEFLYLPHAKVIHMRSKSRVGTYDFGVNRKRLEKVHSLWKEKHLKEKK